MSSYLERKQERRGTYKKYVEGWKQRTCTACNGSGKYDTTIKGRVPNCSCCEGTGKERYKEEIK